MQTSKEALDTVCMEAGDCLAYLCHAMCENTVVYSSIVLAACEKELCSFSSASCQALKGV